MCSFLEAYLVSDIPQLCQRTTRKMKEYRNKNAYENVADRITFGTMQGRVDVPVLASREASHKTNGLIYLVDRSPPETTSPFQLQILA